MRPSHKGILVPGMAPDSGSVRVTPALTVPLAELEFRATTGGGPGGQHVNRSATRVALRWNIAGSPSLSDDQRVLLLDRLAHRLDRHGRLRLVSGARRSQTMNRDDVLKRFVNVVASALSVRKPRRATKPTKAAIERRLEEKRRRGEQKRRRRPVDPGDE